jgi:predicted N-acetyltransferase YhbS
VDPNRIGSDNFACFVAVEGDTILGYYSMEQSSGDSYELEALFVEPAQIGKGIGRKLLRHAVDELSKSSAKCLVIQGDPNATSLYVAAGARRTGSRESGSIPGRHLPLFEIDLAKT